MKKIGGLLLMFLLFTASCYFSAQTPLKIDYIKILQEGKYNMLQKRDFPKFTYQSSQNKNLTELRKQYNLDSISGNGSDINKAINLLQWMHKTVPHEDEYNHKLLTAKNIIETYKNKGLAQGCYPLAIAMNEIFLAMGFQSRIVICFPTDFEHPNGGHVINTVYIQSLDKWVWMDPQFNAYLKDENGNYLSIAEAREKIINHQVIFLNSDADYHGETIDVNYYLYEFMVEHLYRFISPVHSKYNSETREKGKTFQYIELIPSNSKKPTSGLFENHSANGTQVITIHTNNPLVFWEKP
jgi:hypothetical protein